MAINLRQVLRRLVHTPAFTITVILTLALGIAANTAIFSILDAVLLKPLPYANPDQLVGVWLKSARPYFENLNMAPAFYFFFREEGHTFSDIGLWSEGSVSVTGLAQPEQISSLSVTERTLPLLGVNPILGRAFTAQDDAAGSSATALITYGYWKSKFAGSPAVMGRRIVVDGGACEIIGVLPADFRFLNLKPSIVTPFQFDRAKLVLGNFSYQGVARLRPGVTMGQASAELARLIPLSIDRFPPFPGYSAKMFEEAGIAPNLRPFKRDLVGDVGNVLWILMGCVVLVLLLACANAANLLLVRAEGRQQELAIRTALGASSGQVARDLLLESLTLGLAAGAVGLALAYVALHLFVSRVPANLPRMDEISINGEASLFALTISLFSGILFGLVPLFRQMGLRISPTLRSGGRNASQSRQQHRVRNTLVVVQVAIAVVLLISSGLMIRTFQALRDVQPGFRGPQEVQTFRFYIPDSQVKNPEQVTRMQQDVLERISALPGVTSAAMLTSVPMSGNSSNDPIFAEDHAYGEGQIPAVRRFNNISPGLFKTMGTRLIAGRDFSWSDSYNYLPNVIVSENLARELWGTPGGALGKRIRENTKSTWRTVIGVVQDTYDDGLNEKPPAIVYWPLLMKGFEGDEVTVRRSVAFAVRSPRTGSQQFLNALRNAVWSVNASLPLAFVQTLGELYDRSLARASLALLMLAIAGATALLLGVVGIYGVISYSVSQRRREIGIRLAVGAQQYELTRMFVRQAMILSGIGIGVGMLAAITGSRLLESVLFGVRAVDPLTYGVVAVGLVVSALFASFIPARRVSAVDPVEALRAEG